VTVYFEMTIAGSSVSLDLMNDLTVAAVNDLSPPTSSLTFTHTSNVLEIALGATLSAGTVDSLSISYEGVPASTGFGSFITSTHGSPAVPVLWTLSEPYGSRDWWPCKNGLDDKADAIEVSITHPVGTKAASNGLLLSETESVSPAGKIVTHWRHEYKIASYLICFAVTNYLNFTDELTVGLKTFPMDTYCYPESLATFQGGVATVQEAMTFFSGKFGEYPFIDEKYGHVQFGWGGGMEHQTSTFMVNMSESLIAHELAHHWFGDRITCASWEDIWLNEGFATYLASVFKEDKYGTITNRASEINTITSSLGGSVKVDNVSDPNRIFSNRLSYLKGSHLLYMLRWILGDADFDEAIANYQQDPAIAFGFTTTEQLKAHLETASGKDLTYFFNQWYTGQGYPSYQIQWSTSGNNVNVTVNQTASHESVSFFRLPIPLLFKNGTQEKLVVLDNTSSGQIFVENLGFVAESVTFDPESWLITKNNTLTKISNPLPVVFASFSARCEDEKTVIEWTTTSEINASYFEIQKSENAVKWTNCGRVDAAGETRETRKYSFTDLTGGGQFYRVAEFDSDGKVQYTRILARNCDPGAPDNWTVLPNPTKNWLKIKAKLDETKSTQLSVADHSGKILSRPVLQRDEDGRCYQIDVRSRPPGLYVLKIENNGVSKALKFIKE
jgi:hypothetical protein